MSWTSRLYGLIFDSLTWLNCFLPKLKIVAAQIIRQILRVSRSNLRQTERLLVQGAMTGAIFIHGNHFGLRACMLRWKCSFYISSRCAGIFATQIGKNKQNILAVLFCRPYCKWAQQSRFCMNVPIIKFTSVCQCIRKWFSPYLKTTGKLCAKCRSNRWALTSFGLPARAVHSIHGRHFLTKATSPRHAFAHAGGHPSDRIRGAAAKLCARWRPGATQKRRCYRNSALCIQMHAWDLWTRLNRSGFNTARQASRFRPSNA